MYQIESNSHAVSSSIGTQESEPTSRLPVPQRTASRKAKPRHRKAVSRKQQAAVPHQNRKRKPLRLPRLLLPILLLPRQNQNHPRSQCRNQPRNPNQNQHQSRNLIRCPQPPTYAVGQPPNRCGWQHYFSGNQQRPQLHLYQRRDLGEQQRLCGKDFKLWPGFHSAAGFGAGKQHHYRHTWGQQQY